jgi:hypothetical protein
MSQKWEAIDIKLWSKGSILVEGLKLLKSEITELNSPQPSQSISTALIAPEFMQQIEIAPIQTPHYSPITAYPLTNSNAISIIKEEGSRKELIVGMIMRDYLISEEENARGNFE